MKNLQLSVLLTVLIAATAQAVIVLEINSDQNTFEWKGDATSSSFIPQSSPNLNVYLATAINVMEPFTTTEIGSLEEGAVLMPTSPSASFYPFLGAGGISIDQANSVIGAWLGDFFFPPSAATTVNVVTFGSGPTGYSLSETEESFFESLDGSDLRFVISDPEGANFFAGQAGHITVSQL